MTILMWNKPKKVMSSEEYAESYGADGAPPGCYSGNMGTEDSYRWRAKLIKGKEGTRVEIRKTVTGDDPLPGRRYGCHAQLLIVVTPEVVRISQNGPAVYNDRVWSQLWMAVQEARTAIYKADNENT